MMAVLNRRTVPVLVLGTLLAGVTIPAAGQGDRGNDGWYIRVTPYVWFSNLSGVETLAIGEADAMDAAAAFGADFFALPFSVFTDTQGHILGVHTGELHPQDLDDLLSVLEDLETGTTDLSRARARLSGRM